VTRCRQRYIGAIVPYIRMQLKHLHYFERLTRLNLPTLRYRRHRGDMIEVYKILHKLYDPAVSQSSSLGHFERKLQRERGVVHQQILASVCCLIIVYYPSVTVAQLATLCDKRNTKKTTVPILYMLRRGEPLFVEAHTLVI